jgi:hypothetical protein
MNLKSYPLFRRPESLNCRRDVRPLGPTAPLWLSKTYPRANQFLSALCDLRASKSQNLTPQPPRTQRQIKSIPLAPFATFA